MIVKKKKNREGSCNFSQGAKGRAEKRRKNQKSKKIEGERKSFEGIFSYSKLHCDVYWEMIFILEKCKLRSMKCPAKLSNCENV